MRKTGVLGIGMVLASFLFLTGCGSSIKGTWVPTEKVDGNPEMKITGDKLILSAGPMQVTADYKVQKKSGKDIQILVSAKGEEPGPLNIILENGVLEIRDGFMNGRWKRK